MAKLPAYKYISLNLNIPAEITKNTFDHTKNRGYLCYAANDTQMNIEELREYCISKKGVEETLPFGPETLVFKVMGKVFLLTGLDSNPVQFNVKCDPEKAIELREQYPCVKPGYHMNKQHWNTVVADGSVSNQLLQQWITDSYNLVVSGLTKKEKQQLSESE